MKGKERGTVSHEVFITTIDDSESHLLTRWFASGENLLIASIEQDA